MSIAAESDRALSAKGIETRRRIVDAASDLIVERGVSAVTLDDVGLVTATSKSQMYHYFANKDELINAVVLCVRDRVLALHERLLVDVQSVGGLERWAETIISFQRQGGVARGCPLGTLADELMNGAGVERVDFRGAFDSWQRLLAATLSSLQDAGCLRSEADPAALAMATLASLQGGLLMAKAAQDETPLVVALDAALAHLQTFAI